MLLLIIGLLSTCCNNCIDCRARVLDTCPVEVQCLSKGALT